MKLAGVNYAWLQFTDGKVYLVKPVYDADMAALGTFPESPGCWFNKVLRKRATYSYKRLSGWPVAHDEGLISVNWQPVKG